MRDKCKFQISNFKEKHPCPLPVGRWTLDVRRQTISPRWTFDYGKTDYQPVKPPADKWSGLADLFGIRLPDEFLRMVEDGEKTAGNWRLFTPREAVLLKADLDNRYDYPGRQWRGIPFARSTVSEDVACFDLDSPAGSEAMVLPIRDWNGPRWEFAGDHRSFSQWIRVDRGGRFR